MGTNILEVIFIVHRTRPGVLLFSAGCNEQVFPLNSEKKFGAYFNSKK